MCATVWLNGLQRNKATVANKEQVLKWFQMAVFLLLVAFLCLMSCSKEGPSTADTQLPTVEITFPHSNTSVSGNVIIVARAEDNERVVRVEFYIDEVLRYTDEESAWEFSWETILCDNGTKHSIMAEAYDKAGNSKSSEVVSVVVNNELNDPPTAAILTPADSSSLALGEEVVFQGYGRDALGNVLHEEQLAWFSNLDGYLGIGTFLAKDDLSADWHTITLIATDDRELTGKDSISIHISTEGEIFQVTYDAGFEEYPCWSPDGQNLVYASDRAGNYDIWTISVAGGVPSQLTVDSEDDFCPAWHGSEIAFTSFRSGNADIWKISDSGEDLVQLTAYQGWDTGASWSPDGEYIVISSQLGGGPTNLWILSMSGDDPEELTTQPGYEPDWFFGDIAFRAQDGNIYVTSLAGMSPVQITWDPALDMSPNWAPDGNAIVFTSNRSGNEDIWIWSFEDSRFTQLTFYSGKDYDPAWSPDGQWIAFSSDRSGSSDIWIIRTQP